MVAPATGSGFNKMQNTDMVDPSYWVKFSHCSFISRRKGKKWEIPATGSRIGNDTLFGLVKTQGVIRTISSPI